MKANEVKVTFQPFGRSVFVLPGTLLLEAAGRAGIILKTPCGGKRTCGKCKVKVCKGKVSADEREYASTLCRKTEHVDLSLESEFQMQFGSAMIFPDCDIDACPSDTAGQQG